MKIIYTDTFDLRICNEFGMLMIDMEFLINTIYLILLSIE